MGQTQTLHLYWCHSLRALLYRDVAVVGRQQRAVQLCLISLLVVHLFYRAHHFQRALCRNGL